MTSLRPLAVTLALVAVGVVCGCESTDPQPEREQPARAEPAPERRVVTYAGLWKRPDSGAVFEVEDDGELVTGRLRRGTWRWTEEGSEPEEIFDRFEFRLERRGEGLEGQASFRFVDDSTTYTSAWELHLEGRELKGTLEELEFGDDGQVSSRQPVAKTFAFEPKVAPAPPTVVKGAVDQGGFQGDLSAMIRAPGRLVLGEGVAVGYRLEFRTEAAGREQRHFLAVVGEAGDAWRIETDEGLAAYGAATQGAVLALEVAKADGRVRSARVGQPGSAGQTVQVLPPGPEGPGAGDEVEVETPAGSFPARHTTLAVGGQRYETWVGREGDLSGVLLKFSGPDGSGKALQAEPESETLELAGGLEARRCRYDNGDELVYAEHPVIQALASGLVRSAASGVVREVVGLSEDARPRLSWN